MEETFYDMVNRLKAELPIPSEADYDSVVYPYTILGYDAIVGAPTFSKIIFEKEYLDCMCIGWKLSDRNKTKNNEYKRDK
jgi:hypothetical protein